MRLTLAALLCAAAWATSAGAGPAAQAAGPTLQAAATTWSGIYSEAQATQGERLYERFCRNCHGSGAGGGDSPSLTDSGFAGSWNDLGLDQLFDRVRVTMPQDRPGALTREEAAAVVAYLLRQNNFPAGAAALPGDNAALAGIKYLATKP